MMRVLFNVLFLSACLLPFVAGSQAGTIYQWRDAAGQVHFTDNPAMVPSEHKAKARRNVDMLETTSISDDSGGGGFSGNVGKKVWGTKCASCHHLGEGFKDELRGLGHIIIDASTRYPVKMEKILPKLRYAVEGGTSIMDPVALTDIELKALAKYMLAADRE